MTRLTISKCSDWLGGKGIINVLTKNYNVPWKDIVDGTILDLDYYGNHSGNKIISPLVEQLIDNTGLSDGNMNKLAQLIFSKYGYNWTKLWDATQLEYNPIHNYDGEEEEILTVKETGTDSVVGQGGGQSKTYGFNSTTAVDADESSTDTSNTETKDLQTETTRKFKKGGNLGVTTTQQMMTSEYEYRINYEFFIAVFKDVDKILVIESYGDVKIRPCDVIIQSSYTLPPATANSLGGIKVGDNLTITSDGRLSATGGSGSGGVESVNGKVGKVVLNADDVGAYSQSNQPPYPVTKVNNKTGNVTITASELGAYDADNQPPYPVTSVNGKTGKVTINASEIYLSNSDSVETAIGDINTNISILNSNKADIPTYDAIASYGGGIYSSDTSFTMGKSGIALIQVANWTNDTFEGVTVKINNNSVGLITPTTQYKRETLTVPVRNGDVINFSGMSVGTFITINLL